MSHRSLDHLSHSIRSHIPPPITSSKAVHRSTKRDLSDEQRNILNALGPDGLIIRHDPSLIPHLCDVLEQAWSPDAASYEVRVGWESHLFVHRGYCERNHTNNEYYHLHPLFEHHLFRLIQFLVIDNGEELFDFRNGTGGDLHMIGRASNVRDGTTDAMVLDSVGAMGNCVLEIKMPYSPEDGFGSRDLRELSKFFDLASGFDGLRISLAADGSVLTDDTFATTTAVADVLQVGFSSFALSRG